MTIDPGIGHTACAALAASVSTLADRSSRHSGSGPDRCSAGHRSSPSLGAELRTGQPFGCWRCLPDGWYSGQNACHSACNHAVLTARLLIMLEAIHRWENEGGGLPPSEPTSNASGHPQVANGPTDGGRPPTLPLRCTAGPPGMIGPRGGERDAGPRHPGGMPRAAGDKPCPG